MDNQNLEYLLEAAAWQDALLQSYRSLHVTIQSILLALAAGLFVAIFSLQTLYSAIVAYVVLVGMWVFQIYTSRTFRAIIHARGEDVNFWHREIILQEQYLDPRQRHFTRFKIHQKLHRGDAEYLRDLFLSDSDAEITPTDADKLIEKGLGHTRRAVDQQLFQRMTWIWILLILGALVFLALRVGRVF